MLDNVPEEEYPGDDVPEDSGSPEVPSTPIEFALTINSSALDVLLRDSGVCPTSEIRNTVARELYRYAPLWLQDIVQQVSKRMLFAN